MKTPIMLLLTNDNEVEELVADALSEIGAISHLTHDGGDALETICGVNDLDVAIIDFEHFGRAPNADPRVICLTSAICFSGVCDSATTRSQQMQIIAGHMRHSSCWS